MREQLKKLGRHTVIYGAGILIGKAASFIMLPIYTRYLSPTDYGTLELLEMTVDVIGMLAGIGLAGSVFKFYAEYDDPADRGEVISTATSSMIAIAAVTSVIGVLLAPQVTHLVFRGGKQPDLLFRLFFLIYFVQSAATVPLLFVRALQKSVLFVTLNVLRLVLSLSLNILFVVGLRMNIRGVLYSTLIAGTVMGIFTTVYAFRHAGIRFSWPKFTRMTHFALPLVFWSLGSFVLTFSDRYFLNYFTNTATVGIYSLAYQFGFVLAGFAVTPFNSVWDPQRFEVAKQSDGPEVFRRVFFYLNLVLLTIAFVISVMARDLLRVMSAPAFWGAAVIVPVLMLPFILQAWSGYCNIGIYVKSKTRPFAWISVVAVATDLALNYLLIPRYGAIGAAWATVGAYVVRFILVYRLSQRLWHIDYGWGRNLELGAICAVGYGVHLWLAPDRLIPSVVFNVGILLLAGVVVYGQVLSSGERSILKRVIRQPLLLITARA
jgi:O-antigen/teichoic acid export membrane protein